jgi:general nucleoside transport system permease protein
VSGILSTTFFAALVSGAILAGMPLLFAALGETLGEQSGVLGIGMEGYMLIGAYAGINGALYGDSAWVGLLCGIAGGVAIAAVVAVLAVRLGLDQVVVGIGVILLGEGLTSVLHAVQFGSSYPRVPQMQELPIPLLSRIPVVGDGVFSQPLIFWLGIALVFLLRWMLRSTRWGLDLRAAGERPRAVDTAGVDVAEVRSWAVLASGGLAGLGGAYLAVVAAGVFSPYMTNGRGFIAIVIAMLGRGRPGWVLFGALLFGASLSVGTALQLVGLDVPTDVVFMLPFIVVMIALVAFARRSYLPAALGLPYRRGER